MARTEWLRTARRAALGLLLAASAGFAAAAATISIVNADGPGEGFNDPTPVAPVGGNPGLTLGQQRLNAFAYAASVWGPSLDSSVNITVRANFDPLTCTATSAVLGSAGPTTIFADFPGAPVAGTWYHASLASKLAQADLSDAFMPGTPMIAARFNSNLGNAGCLTGSGFYLGLDNNTGGRINLVVVLLHEFGHGLGFSTVTNSATGAQISGLPSIYDRFAYDNTLGKLWSDMTDAERVFSAINPRQLAWTGANVTAAAPAVLTPGTPELVVNAPSGLAGTYLIGAAVFGPPFTTPGLNRQVMPVVEGGNLGLACTPLDAVNAAAVKNRIAFVIRGTCAFTVKVKNAQNAGAVGVLVMDNVAGSAPPSLGGADATITIPSGRISFDDGVKFIGAMNFTPGNRSTGVVARLALNPTRLAGADAAGRVLLYTPNPRQPGSSVSHWDDSATRNLLMEPAINADLTQFVFPPYDLTLPMFKDIGW